MSTTVCRTPATLFLVESTTSDTTKITKRSDQSDFLTVILSQKVPSSNTGAAPYVHPLVRWSSTMMSKSSLQMCTESLGSETGSGDFSSDDGDWLNFTSEEEVVQEKSRPQQRGVRREDDGSHLMPANYHCSVNRRSAVPRSFPPPLSSISRRDGICIQMRTRRHDGRLVIDAVPVASQSYLHARRQDGRLLLSFVDCTTNSKPDNERNGNSLNMNNRWQNKSQHRDNDSLNSPPPSSNEIDRYQEQAEDEKNDQAEVTGQGNIGGREGEHPTPGDRPCNESGLAIPFHQQVCRPEHMDRASRKNHHSSYLRGTTSFFHIKAAEQKGDASPHAAVQRAQPAACHIIVTNAHIITIRFMDASSTSMINV